MSTPSKFFGVKLGNLGIGVNYGFRSSGIGTKEMDAKLFEGDKAEAVIPLEDPAGVKFLSNALKEAGNSVGGGGDEIHVHISPSILITEDNYATTKFAQKIGQTLAVTQRRAGDFSYGSK